jgi:hypothetical protein
VAIGASSVQRAFRWLVISTIGMYIAVAAMGIYFYVDAAGSRARIAEVANDTNNALCALRGDLERRVIVDEAFLEENPEGFPGIPARLIQEGIENQERTIAALSGLDC